MNSLPGDYLNRRNLLRNNKAGAATKAGSIAHARASNRSFQRFNFHHT